MPTTNLLFCREDKYKPKKDESQGTRQTDTKNAKDAVSTS
ncbi:hypothetical protein JCM19231_3561 [Vibrio ishigakensis]|uniref:Uncharacterized protein n=1 Tax=Vibrio ishigakensis TaxID=1481914 RepID=A0A0B8NIM2_9VIBR|nr:hypothetical protein JCM19231_3561 [Vibrio ishigakensis]